MTRSLSADVRYPHFDIGLHGPFQSQEETRRGRGRVVRRKEGEGSLETSRKFVRVCIVGAVESELSADTAFKQQRLKAWQPILTPKTVLPTLFIIGIIFAPIGGLLIWGSSLVSEMTFDYSECENLTPSASNNSLTFSDMPSNKFSYRLRSSDSDAQPSTPRYAFLDNTANSSVTDVSAQRQCIVDFNVPADLPKSVFFYYKLTNFYQNHRRYVKSLDSDQLKGKFVSTSDLNKSDCKPLATINGTAIYPCGLVANSIFNGQWLLSPLLTSVF